jgi:hypothetical protein
VNGGTITRRKNKAAHVWTAGVTVCGSTPSIAQMKGVCKMLYYEGPIYYDNLTDDARSMKKIETDLLRRYLKNPLGDRVGIDLEYIGDMAEYGGVA